MISRIEYIHNKNFIHRDIKPGVGFVFIVLLYCFVSQVSLWSQTTLQFHQKLSNPILV